MNFVKYKDKLNVNLDTVSMILYKEETTRTGKEEAKISFTIPGMNIPLQWKFDSFKEGQRVYNYLDDKYLTSVDEIIDMG